MLNNFCSRQSIVLMSVQDTIVNSPLPPVLLSVNDGAVLRHYDHQQVAIGRVRGEHGRLSTHLAPVPSCARLGQPLEEHLVLVIVTGVLQNIFP